MKILFIFRERGREREREGEEHQCVVASCMPPTGALAHIPGMCPDWESNRTPFDSKDTIQPIEPHQPGHYTAIFKVIYRYNAMYRFTSKFEWHFLKEI